MLQEGIGNCSTQCVPAGGSLPITIANGTDTSLTQAVTGALSGINYAQIVNNSECHDLLVKAVYLAKDGVTETEVFYRVERCSRFTFPKCGAAFARFEVAIAPADPTGVTAAGTYEVDFSNAGTTIEEVQATLNLAQQKCC